MALPDRLIAANPELGPQPPATPVTPQAPTPAPGAPLPPLLPEELTPDQIMDQRVQDLRHSVFATQEQQDRNRAGRIYGVPEPTVGAFPAPSMSRTRVVNGFAVPDINPEAFDPSRYTPPVDISTDEQALLDRLEIMSFMAQATLGIEENEARTVARRLEAMSREMPWITDLVFEDFQTAAMLTEADAIAARFLPQFNMSDQMYRVAADMIADNKNRVSTVKAFELANETIDRGSWLVEPIDPDVLAAASIEAKGKVGTVFTNPDTVEFQHFAEKAEGFIDRIRHQEVQSITTTYDEEIGRLVATVAYTDGETANIDVTLDEGTELSDDSTLEELYLATRGYAHTVNKADELRGPQTLLGKGFQALGDAGRAYDFINAPINAVVGSIGWAMMQVLPTGEEDYVFDWRSSWWQHREENLEELDRQVAAVSDSIGRDDLVMAMTMALDAEYGPNNAVLAASDGIGFVDSMSDEEQGEMTAELLDEDELRGQLEANMDDRSTLKRALDSTLEGAVWLGTGYDQALHWIGTHGIAMGDFVIDTLSTQDVKQGYEMFKDNWQQANESQYLSEYWGWEGPGATWLDVSASLLLDPFIYVTPGGKGLIQVARRRLATRAGAAEAMRLPSTQRVLHMITDSVVGLKVTDDVAERIATTLSRNQMDYIPELYATSSKTKAALTGAKTTDEVRGILGRGDLRQLAGLTRGMDAQHKLALANASSYDDVARIVEDSLPANGGTFSLDFAGHVAIRNTAMNISATSRLFNKMSPRTQDWFRRSLGTYSQQRYVGLGPTDFMDDMEELIFAVYHKTEDADLASEWLERLWTTYDDYQKPFHTDQRMLRESADRLKRELNEQVAGTSSEVRRFGKIREDTVRLEQRVREIDSRMPNATPEEAAKLAQERKIITEGADRLDQLVAARRKIRNKPVADRAPDWEEKVAAIKKAEDEIRSVGVLRMSSTDEAFGALSEAHDAYRTARASTTKQRERIAKLAKKAARPGSRDQLAALVDDLVDEIGNTLGLELRADGKTSALTGRRLHDWSPVTGDEWAGGKILTDDAGVSENLRTLARRPDGTVDEDLLAKLRSIGAGSQQGVYQLPAAGMEMVAYIASGERRAPWLTARAGTQWGDMNVIQRTSHAIGRSVNMLNRIFSGAVLLNLRTMVRSNLDEPIRHMIQTGVIGNTRNRAVGVTPHGLVRENIPGGLQGAVDQMLPGQTKRIVGSRPGFTSDWAASYQRKLNAPGGIDRASARGYDMAVPGDRGFVDVARFWVNGFTLNDPAVSQAWRAIGFNDPDVFMRWWDEVGHQYQRTANVKLEGGAVVPVTAQTAYDAGQNALDLLVAHWPAELQGEARAALLKAAKEGGDVNPRLLSKINKPMPGPVPQDLGTGAMNKTVNWMFEAGYGRPGARRGGLMLQQYQADKLEQLWEAKEAQGKILTPKRLQEMTGMDEEEALKFLATPSEDLEFLLHQQGYYLPQQLAEMSYRWARDKVNNIMYQTGAGSVFGKKFQKFFPFGRATMDYNTFFAQKMTDTLEFGLNPTVARSIQSVRHPGKTVQALATPGERVADEVPLGALGKTFQPSVAGAPVPLNARLAGRVGALFGAGATQVERQLEADPEGRTEPQGPLALMDQITFAPIFPGEGFYADLGPSVGPLPSAVIHLLPSFVDDDDSIWQQALAKIRGFAEDIQPTLAYDDRQYMMSSAADFAAGMTGFFVPDSASSIRGFTENLIMDQIVSRSDNPRAIQTALDWMGTPVGFKRVWKSDLADMLEEGDFVVRDTERAGEILGASMQSALQKTSGEAADQTAKKWGAAWVDVDRYDFAYAEAYSGLIEELDVLFSRGLVGDSQMAEIRGFAADATSDSATMTDILNYADAAGGLLRDLDPDTQAMLLVEHRGLVVNLVSGSQCTIDGPREFCQPDGKLQLPFGQDGRNKLDQGRSEGWIEDRPYGDQYDDMLNRLGSAHRRVATGLWGAMTSHPVQETDDDGNKVTVTKIPTWPGRSTNVSFPKYLFDLQVPVTEAAAEMAAQFGVTLEPGTTMMGDQLADLIADRRDVWAANTQTFSAAETPAIAEMSRRTQMRNDQFGAELLAMLQRVEGVVEDLDLAFDEAPGDVQKQVRDRFKVAINRGLLTQTEYDQDLARHYGPLDYVPPSPPSLTQLDPDNTTSFAVDRDRIEVVDGDTVWVELEDERVRVRLIGVNAADFSTTNEAINTTALEHQENLEAWLNSPGEIHFVSWSPEQFGSVREEVGGEVRYLMWLYKDGEAVFDPESFTFRNPAGASRSGNGVPKFVQTGEVA